MCRVQYPGLSFDHCRSSNFNMAMGSIAGLTRNAGLLAFASLGPPHHKSCL